MDADRFDRIAKTLAASGSRRRVLGGLLGGALGLFGPLVQERAAAGHFGCKHVGRSCTRRRECCSGICQGPRGRKSCRAHGTGTCQAGQNSCEGASVSCNGNSSCFCQVTTGNAAFCGTSPQSCVPCKRDKDCVEEFGFAAGSACGVCAGCSSIGTHCVSPCPSAG